MTAEFSRPEAAKAFEEVLERHATVFEALAKHDLSLDDLSPDQRAWLGTFLNSDNDQR